MSANSYEAYPFFFLSACMSSQALKIVALCVTWYLLSAANNVIGKQILSVFPYPVTLSMVNLVGLAFGLGPSLAALQVAPAPQLSRKIYTRRIIPLALGKLLASVSAHVSVWKVSVSYAHTGMDTRARFNSSAYFFYTLTCTDPF